VTVLDLESAQALDHQRACFRYVGLRNQRLQVQLLLGAPLLEETLRPLSEFGELAVSVAADL